jgi:cell division septum initiation protein DivIVA
MPYTPVELRHIRPAKTLVRGYKRVAIDELLAEVADSFEDVWRERGELVDKLEDVERELEGLKAREQLLATTLVSAEQAAADAKANAQREAELIVAEAHTEARSILRSAQNERERLFAESRRIEALLRSALGIMQEGAVSEPVSSGSPASLGESWPNREDTREFGPGKLLVRTEQGAPAG